MNDDDWQEIGAGESPRLDYIREVFEKGVQAPVKMR
jgi:hypothetical protein